MQRNFDLVVTLLGALRDAPASSQTPQQLAEAVREAFDDTTDEQVAHHLDLLHDADLAKPVANGWRLTWKGYDALEQEEDDEEDPAFDD